MGGAYLLVRLVYWDRLVEQWGIHESATYSHELIYESRRASYSSKATDLLAPTSAFLAIAWARTVVEKIDVAVFHRLLSN